MDKAALRRQLLKSLTNSKAWVLTGSNGLFAYPRGEEQSDQTIQTSMPGAAKVIVETLVRAILGL